MEISHSEEHLDGNDYQDFSKMKHQIPLVALVEVISGEFQGIRLYVVNHSRGLKNEVLYDLHFNKNIIQTLIELRENDKKEFQHTTINLMSDLTTTFLNSVSEDDLCHIE